MSKKKIAAQSAIIIAIFSLGSAFLGFIREVLIAYKFGSGIETDTFFIAITVSGLFTGLIAAGLSTTMIPILSEIQAKEGKEGKINHTNNILNILLALSFIFVLIAWIGAPILVKIVAKGFVGEQFELAVRLTRIGLPVILFSLANPVLSSYLQSEMMFIETAASVLPFNIIYISYLLFFTNKFGIAGLVMAHTAAVASQLLFKLYGLKKSGYKYKLTIDIKDKYIKQILLLTIPVLIGTAINELNMIIDKTLASSLVEGSISSLNYATRLNGLILSIFVSAITTVIYPMLSEDANSNNIVRMKKTMAYGINIILIITIPSTIGLIVLSRPIVEIVFQRGEFDSIATLMTSQALIFYAIGLVSMGIRPLVSRVFYSLQDTKTPMINGAIAVAFNIVLNIILVKYMAHSGLALATSIANVIAVLLLLISLKKKIGSLGTIAYISTFLKTGLASGLMGLVAYYTYHGLYGILGISKLFNFISLLVSAGAGAIVYAVLCYLFNVEEVRDITNKIKVRLIK